MATCVESLDFLHEDLLGLPEALLVYEEIRGRIYGSFLNHSDRSFRDIRKHLTVSGEKLQRSLYSPAAQISPHVQLKQKNFNNTLSVVQTKV